VGLGHKAISSVGGTGAGVAVIGDPITILMGVVAAGIAFEIGDVGATAITYVWQLRHSD
jgi:hypothetical protein